jgi:hypothetical protein
MTKSRRTRWAGHVARIGKKKKKKKRNAYKILVAKPRRKEITRETKT